ncbi:hypothetical protein ACIPSE_38860 [Streptomyces sp. NPDC090106]|uniref:hypothetical protein n=1 Tax=Streptomyces sp. NPDC090106 TaxID=3365946 RepID=UPI0037FBE82C
MVDSVMPDGLGMSKSASAARVRSAETLTEFMSTDPAARNFLASKRSVLGVPVVEGSPAAPLLFEAALTAAPAPAGRRAEARQPDPRGYRYRFAGSAAPRRGRLERRARWQRLLGHGPGGPGSGHTP